MGNFHSLVLGYMRVFCQRTSATQIPTTPFSAQEKHLMKLDQFAKDVDKLPMVPCRDCWTFFAFVRCGSQLMYICK